MNKYLHLSEEVRAALADGRPVVALESTIIAHGLPWPDNLDVAHALEEAVREEGAVPATVGICAGWLTVGMNEEQLARFAQGQDILKVSRRDLASTVALGLDGATTVAATMICAAMAGVRIFATGGIGGVHRGAETSMDVSADLTELAQTRVAVVCAGAKSILDLPKTLEVLETQGVPVLGLRTDQFPAFHSPDSGLGLDMRVDSEQQMARILKARDDLEMAGGEVIANPIPDEDAIDKTEIDRWIAKALAEADQHGIKGKEVTPFLLSRLAELSDGRSIRANRALVEDNARAAARIAVEFAGLA